MRLLSLGLLILGLVAVPLVGCGGAAAGNAVEVTVSSTKMKLEDTDSIEVVFTPEGQADPATATGSAKDQPLKAGRSDAPGVVPGKYKLIVRITPYAGMAPQQRVEAIKEFNKQFEATTSKLSYEVTADANQSIVIDLDANTVTKK
jgi:hypothetical protein